jgi:hypothetical protein
MCPQRQAQPSGVHWRRPTSVAWPSWASRRRFFRAESWGKCRPPMILRFVRSCWAMCCTRTAPTLPACKSVLGLATRLLDAGASLTMRDLLAGRTALSKCPCCSSAATRLGRTAFRRLPQIRSAASHSSAERLGALEHPVPDGRGHLLRLDEQLVLVGLQRRRLLRKFSLHASTTRTLSQ